MTTCKTPMACSIPDMVTYLIRGALVHHGLSDAQSKRVYLTRDVGDSPHPAILEVRVVEDDGNHRQLLRIEDEAHLNSVVNSASTCGYLVKDVRRILEGARD